jgi:hypothetical protein
MSVLALSGGTVVKSQSTTRDRVAKHVVVTPLLKSSYEELKELAKKKPEAALSKAKIKVVNRLFERCQVVLAVEPELEFLELLDGETAIAQASDAVLMIGQFVSAMETFRSRYCRRLIPYGAEYWHVENGDLLDEDGTERRAQPAADEDHEEDDGDDEDEDEARST